MNSIDLVPKKLVIRLNPMDGLGRVPTGVKLSEKHIYKKSRKMKLQFYWPCPIEPGDENINNYI